MRERDRYSAARAIKSRHNRERAENRARTALVLGGGAPNVALTAGALAAFYDRNITFDVVTCSGAGALAGLLWQAPKGGNPAAALKAVPSMYISDGIYRYLPINYKVFQKPGAFADLWRTWLATNPLLAMFMQPGTLWADWIALWAATISPSDVTANSWGLCAPAPFIEHVIDFDQIKDIAPYFYLNAYNVTARCIDNFTKDEITPDHFRAAMAFPLIYGPFKLNGCLYYEGASIDPLNFKDLVELHQGIETIVVLDVLGAPSLIRAPRNLYDSWVLSIIIPLVKSAEDSLDLFALNHNNGWLRSEGANADILKLEFDIPDEHLSEVLDWSTSNATRLFNIGYQSGVRFSETYADEVGNA